jgi:ATP-dependent DNA helicase PIF1
MSQSHRAHQPFGGLYVIFLGDFGQLPPVMDNPMYSNKSNCGIDGKLAYLSIMHAVELTEVMRQLGPEQELFRRALLRLRDGNVTEDDHRLFMSRLADNLPNATVASFAEAPFITPYNNIVAIHNEERLQRLHQPIMTVNAIHTGIRAKYAESTAARGLFGSLRIAIGAEVMLIARNIAVPLNLCNGACGIMKYVYYADGYVASTLPTAIFVEVPSYCGSPFFIHEPKVVPIVPVRIEWESSQGTCSRLQLPITLAWARSIHKSQGQTLTKVRIDIGAREPTTGSTYVALSRASSLEGILLTPAENTSNHLERFLKIGQSPLMQLRKREDLRLRLLETNVLQALRDANEIHAMQL